MESFSKVWLSFGLNLYILAIVEAFGYIHCKPLQIMGLWRHLWISNVLSGSSGKPKRDGFHTVPSLSQICFWFTKSQQSYENAIQRKDVNCPIVHFSFENRPLRKHSISRHRPRGPTSLQKVRQQQGPGIEGPLLASTAPSVRGVRNNNLRRAVNVYHRQQPRVVQRPRDTEVLLPRYSRANCSLVDKPFRLMKVWKFPRPRAAELLKIFLTEA